MDMSYETSITDFKINLFEYCTLMEDIVIGKDSTAKVKIHKLMHYCNEGDYRTSNSIFINDSDCKPPLTGTVSLTDAINVTICDVPCYGWTGKPLYKEIPKEITITYNHTSHKHIVKLKKQIGTKIKKGTLMMVLFMDNNINDAYLTNWITR